MPEDQMRLKKLELNGFKSFAERTAFEFEGALTAFVGPNGAGKSNVVDALKWVLGEQSARRLRGAEMVDMIFNGGPSRKPAGCAEVRLTLENDRGLLPIEYNEVCLARRLYRSGESEYLLNGKACRLKDIRALLLDTGAGVSAYSVMEQGQVDMLLRASSKERRLVLEEAAGINRYLAQKREAELKLEHVRANLERVSDIIEELQRQLRSVRYQAAKARRFKRFGDELRKLRLSLALRGLRGLVQSRSDAADAVAARQQQRLQLSAKMTAAKDSVAAAQQEMTRLREELAQTEERLSSINARHYGLGRELELNEKRRDELQVRKEDLQRRTDEAQTRIAQLRQEISTGEADLQRVRQDLHSQRLAYQECDEALQSAAVRNSELEEAVEKDKSAVFNLMQQATQIQNQVAMLSTEREMLGNRLGRQRELETQLQERCEQSRAERAAAETQMAGLRAEIAETDREAAALQDSMSESSLALERVTSQIGELKADIHGKVSRRQVLEDLEARAEGVGKGVRAILEAIGSADSPLTGAPGLIADLLEVPKQYALAVEAALGSHVQAIVVQTAAQAREALRILRKGRRGRAELIPLDSLRAPAQAELPGGGLQARRLVELVRCPDEAAPAVAALLGNCFLVDADEAAATALARELPGGLRIVTRSGECIEPGGIWSAGGPETGSLISRKSELAELQQEIRDLRDRLESLSSEGGRWAERIEDLRRRQNKLSARASTLNAAESDVRSQLAMLVNRQEQRSEEIELVRSEAASLAEEIGQAEQRIARATGQAKDLRRRRGETEAHLDRLQQALQRQKEAQEGLAARRHALASALARLEEQQKGLDALAQRLRDELKLRCEDRDRIAAEQRQGDLQHQQAVERIESARQERLRLGEEKAELDAKAAEKSRACQAAQERISALQTDHDRLTEQRGEVDRALQDLRVAENEIRLKTETLMDRTREECGVHLEALELPPQQWRERPLFTDAQIEEFAEAEGQEPPSAAVAQWYAKAQQEGAEQQEDEGPRQVTLAEATALQQEVVAVVDAADTDWEALQHRAAKLKKQIESMGGANLDAIREQDELEMRAQFLSNQHDDLDKARRHELEIIRQLSKVSRQSFVETFEAVRANFQMVLRKLFGGGTGDLILDPEEPDVLEAGIDIVVRLPGKQSGPISLLSGGEKAMAAVALLFAIFEAKPSPFCLLDEVDAPLDESNVERFTALLEKYRQNTQFLVVTHNKLTMSAAETLYGVSLQEDGSSRKIAVNFEEVDRRLAEMSRETRSALKHARAG